MTILNGFQGKVNSLTNLIKNPFESSINLKIDPQDFSDGFKIEEILPNGKMGDKIVLAGNWMPKIPFTFGGSQRFKKEFYSGYSEPTMQIFGPEEDDITINGLFKDKRFSTLALKNVATEIQQLVDAVRIRGSIVRLQLGEFERYAIISRTKFDMEKLSRVGYAITFSIIGFNAPKNARFLQKKKEIPFDINKQLIDEATNFNIVASTIPDSVPRSIADQIRSITDSVARAIATVTGFVDQIFSTIQDIKSSINRVKGLIKFAQQTLNKFKRQLGGLTSFDPTVSIAGRYSSSSFASRSISGASFLTLLLQRLKAQFSGIINTLPLGRHSVRTGDTIQKIAIKFYGSSDNWKNIYDYNNLTSTDLVAGALLEVPRL